MKHVLILRALGFVLIIALAVNITAVLAAPLYLNSVDQQAEAIATEPKQPSNDAANDDVAEAPIEGVIEGDVVQSDSPLELASADQLPSTSDSNVTSVLSDGSESDQPSFTATVQSESERVFFDLGRHIGSNSRQDPLTNVVRRFVRRSPSPNKNTDDGEDVLPTVVITRPPNDEDQQWDDNEEPDNSGVDELSNDADQPAQSIARIVLENPSENGYTVRFQLDGTLQTLKPGAVLIETSKQSVVRFDRGGSFGESRQELATGRYQFRVSREGWKLEKAKRDSAEL